MAGFTPINRSSGTAKAANRTRQSTTLHDEELPNRTVASSYLGRDEVVSAVPVKKAKTRGQKRKANAGEPVRSKRRKSSNIDQDVQVRKQRPGDTLPDTAVDAEASIDSTKSEKATAATNQSKKHRRAVSSSNTDEHAGSTNSVSLYAPTTSMNALDSTSQRTSIDSVKANLGQSFTLYQGSSSDVSHHSNVTFSQPHLRTTHHKQTGIQEEVRHNPSHCNDELEVIHRAPAVQAGSSGDTIDVDAADTVDNHEYPLDRQSSHVDDPDEPDCLQLTAEEVQDLVCGIERPAATPPPRARKHNMREVDEHEDYGGSLLSEAEIKLLTNMKNASEGKIKPIVRKPFPSTVQDRSPIFGVSRSNVLRTSFRIGEALTFGAQATRCNINAVIELYARVTMSKRDGRKQHFVFKDLYHDKPPYLEGTYELWDQARLWDLDSTPFLNVKGPGVLSRVIARMKRDGSKWRLEILSIWEASWEDVKYVAGIYGAEIDEQDDDD